MDEGRTIRGRQASLRSDLGRHPGSGPGGTPAMLVEIVDGGSMPGAADHFFAVTPVDPGGPEVEAGPGTFTPGSSTLPVLVIGVKPNVGDRLIAEAISGRWIAERRSGILPPGGCLPCEVPGEDVTITVDLTYVNKTSGTSSISWPMTADGPGSWRTHGSGFPGIDNWTQLLDYPGNPITIVEIGGATFPCPGAVTDGHTLHAISLVCSGTLQAWEYQARITHTMWCPYPSTGPTTITYLIHAFPNKVISCGPPTTMTFTKPGFLTSPDITLTFSW